MKNVNILSIHWYRGGLPKKGGLGQFADLGGRLGMKERGVFLRGRFDVPIQTMASPWGHNNQNNKNIWISKMAAF